MTEGCPFAFLCNLGTKISTLLEDPRLSFLDLPWTPQYTALTQWRGESTIETIDLDYDVETFTFLKMAVAATILFTAVMYTFEHVLDERQRKCLGKDSVFPEELKCVLNEVDEGKKEEEKLLPQLIEKFPATQSYGRDKLHFSIIQSCYGVIETIACILLGALPYTWDKSTQLYAFLYGSPNDMTLEQDHEISITLVFFICTTILGTFTAIPWDIYSTFYIEKKHGFNKMSVKLFITDKIKSFFLTMIIGCPVLALVITIIQSSGPRFYLYIWLFTFVFSIIMMTLVPIIIMPLFNRYTPIADGDLKTQTYTLAQRLNYPLKNLYVMDGSKRSSHSNAFMYGFWNHKRIVVFDTLMNQLNVNEIIGVIGHELGHWKLGHTVTNFLMSQAYFGVIFYIFSLCWKSTNLYTAFGFNDISRPIPTIIALTLFFQTLWSPIDKLISFLTTLHSRKCEFEADEFSKNLGFGNVLQTALVKLSIENASTVCVDKWFAMYHYSHPLLVERIAMIRDGLVVDKKEAMKTQKKDN